MNKSIHTVLKPALSLKAEQARDIRARAWAFIFECFDHHEKEAVSGRGGEEDASDELHTEKGVGHDLTSNPCSVESVKPGKEMKGQNMSLWIAEDYEPLPPGLYVGKHLDIESRESTNGEYRRWSWEILEGPYAGRKVYANTSTNFGPQAKARQWVENILDRELEAGEQVGVEDLVGGKHHLMIENVKRDGRTFDNVSSVHKYRE